uniref:SRCR domain-containing protein n=1 Tax=Amphimedon queenslandica TaxID=400682 RepID=A0A1X7VNN3_AMPQE
MAAVVTLFLFLLFSVSLVYGCSYGSVRLYDNGSVNQTDRGTVQYCYSGYWNNACNVGWDCPEANVACRQLGYLGASTYYQNAQQYFGSTGYSRRYYYSCSGSESSLTSCSSSYYYSCQSSSYAAGVQCIGEIDANNNTANCSESGSVQLTGGATDSEGVLHYCYNGAWVQFCSLGDKEATVACKQLGYEPFARFISLSDLDSWEQGYSPLTISCSSYATESDLSSCSVSSSSSYSYSSCISSSLSCASPKAIRCYRQDSSCTDGSVRLVNGSVYQEGRVEVCVDGVWGSVCSSGWDTNDARVVCKQLGYADSVPVVSLNGKYGVGDGPIYFSDLSWGLVGEVAYDSTNQSLIQNITCNGTTHSISDCIINEGSCTCQEVISLTCYEPTGCEEGAVRITDGLIENEGRLEVCVDGVWGSVCDDGWDKTDAHVACQQLGFSELEPEAYYGSTFGVSTGPIMYSNVKCGGWETSLDECAKTNYVNFTCTGDRIAGAFCLDGCRNGDIRLSGYNQFEGVVQICVDNVWGVISGESWTYDNSLVICRQLGYDKSRPDVSAYDNQNDNQRRAVFLSNVTCNGIESSLDDCDKVLYPLNVAKQLADTTDEIAAVACIMTTPTVNSAAKSEDPYFIAFCILGAVVLVLLIVMCVIVGSKLRDIRKKRRLTSRPLPSIQLTNVDARYEMVHFAFSTISK